MSRRRTVLIVASHFTPNVGGVETHLNDLLVALQKRGWNVVVSTYKPLAAHIPVSFIQKDKYLTVYRMPWVGFNLVHKLTPYPILEFLYLFPGLFFLTTLVLLRHPEIKAVHAQGLVPGVVGFVLGRIFKKRAVMGTHNLYFFPRQGLYRSFSRILLSQLDQILCLSEQSEEEIKSIGVPADKVRPFRYWLNLRLFRRENKVKAKRQIGQAGKFLVFFVGRLIETKGVRLLEEVAKEKELRGVTFIFAGVGPLSAEVESLSQRFTNILYVGSLRPEQVKLYMNAADVVTVPSLVDEGYGRVAMEAIACGTPVLASQKGGLMEVVTKDVGILADPTPKAFYRSLLMLKRNPDVLRRLAMNTPKYAQDQFSEDNVSSIISSYQG